MANNENNDLNQSSCCSGGECSPKDGGGGFFKTSIFAIIIILALGVTAYSLFFKKNAATADCAPGAVPKPVEYLSEVPGLREELSENDFAILVFSDGYNETSSEIKGTLDNCMKIIQSKSPGTEMLVLTPEAPYYQEAVDHYVITGFPAVLTLGRYGNRLLIRSGITDLKLLAAYNDISAPPACCP